MDTITFTRREMSFRVPVRTRRQLEHLATRYHSMTAVVVAAVDRMYAQEVPTMTHDDDVIRTLEEAQAMSDQQLWAGFAEGMSAQEIVDAYGGYPDPVAAMDVYSIGWTATPEIARYVTERLWAYANARVAEKDADNE